MTYEPSLADVARMTEELLSSGGAAAHVTDIFQWAESIADGTITSQGWMDDEEAESILTGTAPKWRDAEWMPDGYIRWLLREAHAPAPTPQALPTSEASERPQEPAQRPSGGGAKPFIAPFPEGHDRPLNVGTLGRFGRPGPDDPLLLRIHEAGDEAALRSLYSRSQHLFSAAHKEAVRLRTRELRSRREVPA